jgi:hypothetical protein
MKAYISSMSRSSLTSKQCPLHFLVLDVDARSEDGACELVRLLNSDLDVLDSMANVSRWEPFLRNLLGDTERVVFVIVNLIPTHVELEVLGELASAQYVKPQLTPVTPNDVARDHVCGDVEERADSLFINLPAGIDLTVSGCRKDLIVLEERAEGIGDGRYGEDDLWLGLCIETGEECEVASGGGTRDGEAGRVDGANLSQLLDEPL